MPVYVALGFYLVTIVIERLHSLTNRLSLIEKFIENRLLKTALLCSCAQKASMLWRW